MDDYSALAERIAAGIRDVRGCLILSRDGMVLGAYPDGDEAVAKPAWLRFAALGEARRGFVEFGDALWVYVHRGPYAGFALADPSVRPGLLMDQLEQALLTAEEARSKREPITLPESRPTSSRKPRVVLHPTTPDRPQAEPAEEQDPAPVADAGVEPEAPEPVEATPPGPDDDQSEIDRIMLATEFSRLLQVESEGDEASS